MVMGVPCAAGRMLTGGTTRDFCAGDTCSGAFGCSNTPGSTVALVGGATSFVSFTCTWGTGVAVTGTASGSKHCGTGADETIVLGFTLGLI